jgi:hypothetical protein
MIRLAVWVAFQAERFTCDRDKDGRPACRDGRLGYCDAPPRPSWWTFEGRSLPRCPSKLIPPWAWRLFPPFRAWRAGFLLRPGGLSDQPRWYLEAMGEMDATMNRLEREKIEESRHGSGQ